ncbi:MAG: deoxyribodipyrimidine photolyase [Gammaproteobacteria bacterium]|nr:deoxyribodipyrimidine photolyase [Gammaproteobacteria bacterium]NIR84492.1 deoxyribodipyrimidine photolyase [Gammaproteobacteria bacterium]NIR90395.1 deoxyribodipyrimidine photolyase [Gammaproteobacteria bacterium]NIU05543.1 deoxyribodipyrimidine photolyase [Gammaproteobacteria bacterium]NIV52682.1 deoxyribodipyrimidine photolyase [Gammaproteobacteria bacterium]
MATIQIQTERIRALNDAPTRKGDYVLYWMQQSQRAECNHALEYAVRRANERGVTLLVVFGLVDDYPEANLRHYRFLLEGLRDVQSALARRGIKMIVERGEPPEVALRHARSAALVVCDRGYLRHQKAWRNRVAHEAGRSVVQVESDVVVPVDTVTNKAEYAARTIRPKIHRHLQRFLVALKTTPLGRDSLGLRVPGLDLGDLDGVLARLTVDGSVTPVSAHFRGGTTEAKRLLRQFLAQRFSRYGINRNRPENDDVSHMSMYLHFGQISPLTIALEVQTAARGSRTDRESYLEELIVRRELAANFTNFTRDYDRFSSLPQWARRTLAEHQSDPREHRYTRRELEAAATHDPYWNAAMREMKHTGFMHNYMRMYWGKKILEWMDSPKRAYETALALNNKYFLDGRDPASYANVGWIFGLHDRPWFERPIYGKVRYMSGSGLERKCDIDGYVRKVEALTRTDAEGTPKR